MPSPSASGRYPALLLPGRPLKRLAFPLYKPLPSSRTVICCRRRIRYSGWDLACSAEGTRHLPFVRQLRPGHTQGPGTVSLRRKAGIPVCGCWAGLGRAGPVLNDAENGTVGTRNASRKPVAQLCDSCGVTPIPGLLWFWDWAVVRQSTSSESRNTY